MNFYDLIDVVILIGKRMIECGGETNRAEDSMKRILTKYNFYDIDIFAISNQITISAKNEGKDYTRLKIVGAVNVNFHQLEELNDLSRYVCSNDIEIDELRKKYDDIIGEPSYPLWRTIVGSLLCSSAFSVFFGGDWQDLIIAAILGLLIVMANCYIKPKMNGFMHTIIISFITGALGILCHKLNLGNNLDKVLIGTVMLLIPGMALTNGVRDVFLGDTICGTIRIIESIITAVCIAVGYGLAIYAFSRGTIQYPSSNVRWYIYLISGTVGSFGFGIVFHMRMKNLIVALVGTIITLAAFIVSKYVTDVLFVRVFTASLFACIYGEIAARYAKMPAICIMTIAEMPLYPGGALYYTLAYLVYGDHVVFRENIITTGTKILAVACGVVVTSVVFKYVHKLLNLLDSKIRKG